MGLRKNAKLQNEKNGFEGENGSNADSGSQQLEWTGAGELPAGAA